MRSEKRAAETLDARKIRADVLAFERIGIAFATTNVIGSSTFILHRTVE
jgi:hypothetical protein